MEEFISSVLSHFIYCTVHHLFRRLFQNTIQQKLSHQRNIDIIWLDKKHDDSTLKMIKQLNFNRVIIYTSIDDCVKYISSLDGIERRLCLITSGSLGTTQYEYMKKRYEKIQNIYNNHQDLIIYLQIYLNSIDPSGSVVNIFNLEKLKEARKLDSQLALSHFTYSIFDENRQCSMRDISKSDTFFLWLKLLTHVLKSVHRTDEAIKEMLDECRIYYKNDNEETKKIKEFEKSYKRENAIYWYTTPTFVSKLINKALKTEDFRALYVCRAYIADLSEQLHREYEEYKQLLIEFAQPFPEWVVYHGRTMSQDEIDVICSKKGQLISLNGFLSTSRKKNIADMYSQEVMFIIKTTFRLNNAYFAHVAPMSNFPEEDEVLFDLASVFKIVDIKYNENEKKWNIFLDTTDEGTSVVQAYIESAKQEANEINIDFIFARLLLQMGQYNLAHDYLNKLSMTLCCEDETRDTALVHYYKGLNYYREGDYSQSLVEYEKALSAQEKLFPEGHSDLGETLGGIGLVYDSIGKYNLTLEKHLKGLSVSQKVLPEDHVHIAESLHNVGLCYDRLGDFELAMKYNILALEMKQRLFPHDHPDVATSLNNIGLAYYNHLEFEKALEYHEKALQMKELCLPADHPELAISYCNLGLAHLALNNYDQAVIYHMKDLAMSEKTLPADHAEIGISHHNLGQVYRAKEKGSILAIKHYEKAIDIYMKSLPRQHPYIGMSLMFLAEVSYDQNNLLDAIRYAEEAFTILQNTLAENHRRLAESAYILAKIYKELNRYDKALNYACKARDIQLKTLDTGHKEVQKTLDLIESIQL